MNNYRKFLLLDLLVDLVENVCRRFGVDVVQKLLELVRVLIEGHSVVHFGQNMAQLFERLCQEFRVVLFVWNQSNTAHSLPSTKSSFVKDK